ncbi:cobalt-zinc-cadmium efflux system membrane fusion protein [Pseudomonas duriflava]|uniref:Cobalt-zinc-cadmium efflux system membrane fusion protein n=1 Tax=Pseudomonas duriflava TaxID=459528 RepID=A0A562PV21_9PSED|nr:efflux RND transporter periplasmic adaptor subunit [Pseudomonas duriflava]TWI48259.1 cobalt-zinc-cadmium efflux system membrane fusion protein [Pseudomonas duriflava]
MSKKHKTKVAAVVALMLGLGLSAGIDGTFSSNAVHAEEHGHDADSQAEEGHEHSDSGHDKASKRKKDDSESHSDKEHDEAEEHGHEEHKEGELELSAEQIKTAGITLAQAKSGVVNSLLELPGEITFDEDRTAHIVPRVAGVVEAITVGLGQHVKKGQLLATISSQQISEQRSELAAAKQRAALARTLFERERTLWQDKISAEQDYLEARQALQEAEISLKNAQQKMVALSGSSKPTGGNRYELRAPFDGMIIEKHIALGEVVNENSNVFIISDLAKVWATFNVSAKDLAKVTVGKAVEVSAPELETQVSGVVAYVGSLLGEQTRAAMARVTLPNPEGAWRPGLFVTIKIATSSQRAAVTVPAQAIQTIENKPTVFIRTAEGFQAQSVKVGARDGQVVEVVQGLTEGTQIAAEGSFILKSELGKGSAEHSH